MTANIRVGGTVDEPYAYECFNKGFQWCRKPGIDIQYIYTVITEMLHLNISWVKYDSYPDMENALTTGEIDIIGITYEYDNSSIRQWRYTDTVSSYAIGLLVKTTLKSHDISALLLWSKFTIYLWLSILLICVVVVILKQIGTILKCYTTKTIHALWFFIVSILLNLYGNLIAVDLMLPDKVMTPCFDSIMELGEKILSKQCRLAMTEGTKDSTFFADELLQPKHNRIWAETFRTAYEKNPPLIVKDREELTEFVMNSDCLVGVDYFSLEGVNYYDYYCGIKFLYFSDDFASFAFGYYLRSERLTSIIDNVVTTDAFYGLSKSIKKTYFHKDKPQCERPKASGTLNIDKVLDGFSILLIGLLLSLFSWIVLHLKNFKRHRLFLTANNRSKRNVKLITFHNNDCN